MNMSELRNLQERYTTIISKLSSKAQRSQFDNRQALIRLLQEYQKNYNLNHLYPEDLDFIERHGRHPNKNVKRLKESLELLVLRMERETKNLEI